MKVSGLERWGDAIVDVTLSNGNIQYYVEKNGMFFEVGLFLKDKNKLEVYKNVTEGLMQWLLNAYIYKFRVRIWYGDQVTGRSWLDEYDTMGRIERTAGKIKIPILIKSARSWGGLPINLGNIVRIDCIEDKETIWKVHNFHVEEMKVEICSNNSDYKFSVLKLSEDTRKWEGIANFKTEEQAKHWIAFMRGERYKSW